jgi:hypothetical protein
VHSYSFQFEEIDRFVGPTLGKKLFILPKYRNERELLFTAIK